MSKISKEVNVGNGPLAQNPNRKVIFKLADGSVTLDKLGLDVLKVLAGKGFDVLYQNPLPWFELDKDTGYLYAYYANDGSIEDIWLEESTGFIWVRISRCPKRSEEDGWIPVYPNYGRRVIVYTDLENEVCPVALTEDTNCTVFYENGTEDQEFTVHISEQFRNEEGEQIVLTVRPGMYAEVNYYMAGGKIFARGG